MNKDTTLSYFTFHYKLLSFFGLGYFYKTNNECSLNYFQKILYMIYSCVQFSIWVIIFSVTLWLEIPNIYKDLDKLMLNLTFTITFTSTFVKLYIILFRYRSIQEIIRCIDHDFYDIMQSEDVLKETINRSKRVTLSVLGFANITVIGLITGGAVQAIFSPRIFYNKYHNQTFTPADRILPIPVYLPFTVHSDLVYAFAFIYQILGIAWYGNLVVVINTFMNTILIHFAGRFENMGFLISHLRKITIMRLTNKLKTTSAILTHEDVQNIILFNNNETQQKHNEGPDIITDDLIKHEMNLYLKKCIEHHIKLLSCVDKCENTYSLGFLTHVLNNLSIVCYIMIQISENDVISIRFVTATALFFTVVSEMLVQCYTGNEMSLQALSVAQSAYNCEWYMADMEFKQSLIILMMRAQKPVIVSAGKFAAISNSMFVNIMRGAYSFYAVIRNT